MIATYHILLTTSFEDSNAGSFIRVHIIISWTPEQNFYLRCGCSLPHHHHHPHLHHEYYPHHYLSPSSIVNITHTTTPIPPPSWTSSTSPPPFLLTVNGTHTATSFPPPSGILPEATSELQVSWASFSREYKWMVVCEWTRTQSLGNSHPYHPLLLEVLSPDSVPTPQHSLDSILPFCTRVITLTLITSCLCLPWPRMNWPFFLFLPKTLLPFLYSQIMCHPLPEIFFSLHRLTWPHNFSAFLCIHTLSELLS